MVCFFLVIELYSIIIISGRSYSMSIRGLCYSICDAAERYYKRIRIIFKNYMSQMFEGLMTRYF